MADPLLAEQPPPPPLLNSMDHDPDAYSSEFDSLPMPHMDSQFYPSDTADVIEPFISDLGLGLETGDFELTFDDLDDFLISDGFDDTPVSAQTRTVQISGDHSPGSHPVMVSGGCDSNVKVFEPGLPDSGDSEISGNDCSDVARFLNYASSESSQNTCDRDAKAGRSFNYPSPDSGDCDRELSGGLVSSQGSGNCGSGFSEGMSLPSDSGNCERDVSSHMVIDQKVKVEEIGKVCVSKRKKEQGDPHSESRTSKYRRSLTETENVTAQSGLDAVSEEDEKRKARLMRNRESAQLSRQRKKHYVEELEDKVRAMHSTIADLNSKISIIMAENANLRHQLGSSGMCPPPPPGMYPHPPMAPMAYPWMPCAPYVMKPQGTQVPLVAIPRLKPQQPVPASKAKRYENKKTEGKAKKVASISFLGLLFFIMLFGGLAPIVNVKYGGLKDEIRGGSVYVGNNIYDLHPGKLLKVNGHSNGSDHSRATGFSYPMFDAASGVNCDKSHVGASRSDVKQKDHGTQARTGSDEFVSSSNASESLVASLYVPRNDKLVKIDGNLIIHSVLASEKAMASHVVHETNAKETGLAIPRDLAPALAIPEAVRNGGRHPHLFRNPTDRQKALSSGSADTVKDHYKSSTGDGKLQQWFREGLAGPLLSSGMCTEVFRFDVLPTSASGAIIPASSVANISAQNHENVTYHKRKNRRSLHGLPVPVTRANLNVTEKNPQKDGFKGNKSVSSMVVSVLIDPREVGDIDSDGMMAPKSLSRIFVVVLLDSVKYVTYSCMLPRSGPHLVTT